MKGRSTSWFDRGQLKALFKGVRPARPGVAEEEAPADEAMGERRRGLGRRTLRRAGRAGPGACRRRPSTFRGPSPAGKGPRVRPRPPGASVPEEAPPSDGGPAAIATASEPDREPAVTREPGPVQEDLVASPPETQAAAPERGGAGRRARADAAPASRCPAGRAPAGADTDLASESLWRQSEAILHLARGQAATQALEERLWEITETAASVLSLARASVWTFEDEERTRLHCADFYFAVRDVHESGQIQAARDYPLYFAALHSERPIVAPDAKADPRTRELLDGSLAAAQSRIEAPIFVAGRLTGVVRLEHEGLPRRFEHHEERFASSLADLAGLALEAQERRLKEAVARVGEERVRAQRDALAELSRSEALTRGQLNGVLHGVTEAAARVLRLDRASVWVYAPDYQQSLLPRHLRARRGAARPGGRDRGRARSPSTSSPCRPGGGFPDRCPRRATPRRDPGRRAPAAGHRGPPRGAHSPRGPAGGRAVVRARGQPPVVARRRGALRGGARGLRGPDHRHQRKTPQRERAAPCPRGPGSDGRAVQRGVGAVRRRPRKAQQAPDAFDEDLDHG